MSRFCIVEISLPNEQSRLEILKIHSRPINKSGEIDFEAVVKLSEGFNGADLRNVCTEAGVLIFIIIIIYDHSLALLVLPLLIRLSNPSGS